MPRRKRGMGGRLDAGEGMSKSSGGKKMRMGKDQRGFTIVELLIAIAILSIVVASVCGFILVGSRNYASGNSDINVQQEAQLSLNQMSDVLIDTTRSVNYMGYDGSGNPVKVLKDAEFTFTPEDKSLVMYNGVVEENVSPSGAPTTEVKEGNGNKHYHFYWSKQNETLYYAELDVQPGDVDISSISFPIFTAPDPDDPLAAPPAGWVELASHVTDFSVDLSQVEEKRVVQLSLTFLDGKREYVTSNNVTIRNKVGVNDAELAALDKKKTLAVKIMDNPIVEPGETFHFSVPKVTGKNVADKSVEWSVEGMTSADTEFTDKANGVLKVGKDETTEYIKVTVKTIAADSEGKRASDSVNVHLKRVMKVNLAASGTEGMEGNVHLVKPGGTYTITADVTGYTLEQVCSVCGDDTTMDKQVIYEGNPYRDDLFWQVYNPSGAGGTYDPTTYASLENQKPNSVTLKIAANAPTSDKNVSHGFVVRSISMLSAQGNAHNREYLHYDEAGDSFPFVPGVISFKVVQGKENALPLSGELQYGSPDDDLHEDLKSDEEKGGLSTENPRYVTCIRVVDNTGVKGDKVLLHFTLGGGANIRIVPDMFDLDLDGSYTFYMQVLDVPNDGGVTYSKEEIWTEYWKHHDETAPYGYNGDIFDCRSVRYAKLDKPKLTLMYKEVAYTGKQVTFDPLNVYLYGEGSSIISRGSIWPTDFYQIERNKAAEQLKYSIYKDEGGKWTPIYYFDRDSMSYKGDNEIKDSNNVTMAKINVNGDPFLQMLKGDKQQLCGNYRIVPGITYDNTNNIDKYEYIGWDGFEECPYAPGKSFKLNHEKKYYSFNDSTIYVELADEFTMDIDHSDFKGQAMFPLPKDMKRSPLFPNINSMDEQKTSGKLTVKAQRDNSWNAEDLTFTYVNYRYIKATNEWEVEPVRQEYRSGMKKIQVHSYGLYKCGESEKKWTCIKLGGTTEKDFTIQRFDYNNSTYRTEFPLPVDGDFPFVDGTGEIKRTVELYDSNMQKASNVPVFTVSCKKNGDEYEIAFRTERREDPNNNNNHKMIVQYYGTYTWREGQKEWTWKSGNRVEYTTDLTLNLKDLEVNNTSCMAYFPLPTESGFPFAGGTGETKRKVELYDSNYQRVTNNVPESFTVSCKKNGDEYEITFRTERKDQTWNSHKIYVTYHGTYTWSLGQDEWAWKSGYSTDVTTDLVTNLENLTVQGTTYKMYFPLPSESSFPFKNGVTEWTCDLAVYEMTDTYGENARYFYGSVGVKYQQNGNKHTITFVKYEWWGQEKLGTFKCTDGETGWTKEN